MHPCKARSHTFQQAQRLKRVRTCQTLNPLVRVQTLMREPVQAISKMYA